MSDEIFSLEAALNRGKLRSSGGLTVVRVLIVDDNTAVRQILGDAVRVIAGADVCGEAIDSEETFDLIARAKPDLIVMRADLPGMNGLQITRSIMVRNPVPIVVMIDAQSSDPEIAFESLRSGALALIPRPVSGSETSDVIGRMVACVRTAMTGKGAQFRIPDAPPLLASFSPPRLIALIADAGATGSLMRMLDDLPPLSVPVLLSVDIDNAFFPAFVSWFDASIRQEVVAAAPSGEGVLAPDRIYVLSSEMIATVTPGATLSVSASLPGQSGAGIGDVSAADLLLFTMAQSLGSAAMAVLFGHIGNAGVSGLLAIKRIGGCTLAEFPALCPFAQAPVLASQIDASEICGSPADLATCLRDIADCHDKTGRVS